MRDELAKLREPAGPEPEAAWRERRAVREFVADATQAGLMQPQCDSWLSGFSPAFSAALGERGWIGMTWPQRYGGRALGHQLRFAVIEELLAAGAPVAAHWFADRQVGPGLLKHGTEPQRLRFLPEMARGRRYFCIGMSEPDSGSDLGSVRTRGRRAGGGWLVRGSKIWTSHAQHAHFILALVRTADRSVPASAALTQLIVDMSAAGVTVRPVRGLDGGEHFCEVFFDDVFVPDDLVLGEAGRGWQQVLAELALERSGPERFLSTFALLRELTRAMAGCTEPGYLDDLGRVLGRLGALRALSARVNAALDGGSAPAGVAALAKDMGTRLENDIIELARKWQPSGAASGAGEQFLAQAQARAPGFTLRGGASEILRNMVARALIAA